VAALLIDLSVLLGCSPLIGRVILSYFLIRSARILVVSIRNLGEDVRSLAETVRDLTRRIQGPSPALRDLPPQTSPKTETSRTHAPLRADTGAGLLRSSIPVASQQNLAPSSTSKVEFLAELYNRCQRDPRKGTEWGEEFSKRRGCTLAVKNAAERLRDASIAPEFSKDDNGYIDVLASDDGRYVVAFPRSGMVFDERRWASGGLEDLFSIDGKESFSPDSLIEVVKSAKMSPSAADGLYRVIEKGVLRLQ
jgi:hypothetical protein